MTLAQCIDRLVKKHGGVRAAARAAGIDAGYLTRLRNGAKEAPSDCVLEALGIEKVSTYKMSRKPAEPFLQMSRANAAAYHGDIDGDFDY